MSKGDRNRRRRHGADDGQEQGPRAHQGRRADDELIRLDASQLAGVIAIGPEDIPPGLELDYPGVCALLSEQARIVLPESSDQVIRPRSQGYAVLALADPAGKKLTVVTNETDKARTAQGLWRSGLSYGEDFAITVETTVAYVDGWPVPVVVNPEADEPHHP